MVRLVQSSVNSFLLTELCQDFIQFLQNWSKTKRIDDPDLRHLLRLNDLVFMVPGILIISGNQSDVLICASDLCFHLVQTLNPVLDDVRQLNELTHILLGRQVDQSLNRQMHVRNDELRSIHCLVQASRDLERLFNSGVGIQPVEQALLCKEVLHLVHQALQLLVHVERGLFRRERLSELSQSNMNIAHCAIDLALHLRDGFLVLVHVQSRHLSQWLRMKTVEGWESCLCFFVRLDKIATVNIYICILSFFFTTL